MRKGTTAQYRKAIMDGIYAAMRESFNVPENDRFMLIHQHDEDEFDFSTNYLDIQRSDRLVFIQLTISNTRTIEQKKAFFAAIVARLTENPGLRPEDIFINLVEGIKENWSFGHGIAQYA